MAKKQTKRALITSVISLLVCFSMLVGTTFAWFTDSVTSSGNIIKSGTLDVATDQYYQEQINASKEWADKQSQLQQEQTDFAIEKIEQQKEQAKQDYTKEQSGAYVDWQKQSGAYVDWQKQSNQYGANAEAMASQGMAGTGYSESSQVSMYNTYQNRVTTAKEAYSRAILNYNNAITEARLQNNSL